MFFQLALIRVDGVAKNKKVIAFFCKHVVQSLKTQRFYNNDIENLIPPKKPWRNTYGI